MLLVLRPLGLSLAEWVLDPSGLYKIIHLQRVDYCKEGWENVL